MLSNSISILVTGGAGYIGSHVVLELLEEGMEVIVYDNFSNSSPASMEAVTAITGKAPIVIEGCILDQEKIASVFEEFEINAVIHFAGVKSVGESVQKPLMYYKTNMYGTLNLLEMMQKYGVSNFVFSSSATVYGEPQQDKIKETHPLNTLNPYGTSKLMSENMIRDVCQSNPKFNATLLRYFNPVGNHPSGLIGEDPNGIPNNLVPVVMRVMTGEIPFVQVFGNDYDTPDGTGMRDYIHVVDLAKGHVAALKHLFHSQYGCRVFNMGTGQGYSVLDIISTMERVSKREIPFRITQRRKGDAGKVIADPSLAAEVLGWKTSQSLENMCEDAWKFQLQRKRTMQLV
jgi:UDP-glucose 4-epimerase